MPLATYAAAQILRVLPRERITRAVGRLCDRPLAPRVAEAVVRAYSQLYQVDLAEAAERTAPYGSFDDFFTRSLRQGARPTCADPAALVSPSDGKLLSSGPVGYAGRFLVKGRPYTAAELLGDESGAARYDGGQFAVVYLSPRDYHRVHAPVAGRLSFVRSLPGDLFPVNAIGERHVASLFSINRRVCFGLESDTHGLVCAVMVGAMIVGRITTPHVEGHDVPIGLHTLTPPPRLERGDELGVFHMGSTVVLFVEPGRAPLTRALGPVRVGEALGDAR